MEADRIDITYFTDPLCCWSWAMEPQWRKLAFQFRDHIKFKYCMGGLIPSWNRFVDHVNSISRPAQMGPLWMHAEKVSGMPMAHRIWSTDPPSSSFPACVAIKCASLQSRHHEELFLRKVREFCHLRNKNVADTTVLNEVAGELASQDSAFRMDKFLEDFQSTDGQKLFRIDWEETKRRDIIRFPTLLLKKEGKGTINLSGYRSFSSLKKALLFLHPQLAEFECNQTISEYREYWGELLPRETLEFNSQSEIQVS
jgi:putative protein-disulfide isomerase